MATLEFNYADQIAIIGPLQLPGNPHRWDLCEDHARRTSVPQGWRLEIKDDLGIADGEDADEEDLLALAEAVQRAYQEADSSPEEPQNRLVRREEIPIPIGRHPAKRNLSTKRPRRHLRAVEEPE